MDIASSQWVHNMLPILTKSTPAQTDLQSTLTHSSIKIYVRHVFANGRSLNDYRHSEEPTCHDQILVEDGVVRDIIDMYV
jgi:hypothetical protein